MANIANQKTKALIGKWNKRIAMVEKINNEPLTFEKKCALAGSLEQTYQRMVQKEATNPGSIGAYKRYALDIVTATVPNLMKCA